MVLQLPPMANMADDVQPPFEEFNDDDLFASAIETRTEDLRESTEDIFKGVSLVSKDLLDISGGIEDSCYHDASLVVTEQPLIPTPVALDGVESSLNTEPLISFSDISGEVDLDSSDLIINTSAAAADLNPDCEPVVDMSATKAEDVSDPEPQADIPPADDVVGVVSEVELLADVSAVADEIDLNSDGEGGDSTTPHTSSAPQLELRSEPEDIFEDIPEPQEFKKEISLPKALGSQAAASRSQAYNSFHAIPPTEERKDAIVKTPEERDDKFITITVKDPQKIGDGISSYLTYQVITRTNIGLFKKKEMTVPRRFSDFLGLHEKLAEKYLHKGRLVPAPPEKNVVGTTKVKMASSQPEQEGKLPEFVERRRAALERYLNRTAIHPIFQVDPDFRDFLECESDLPRASNTSALSGAGVLRLFNRMGETVTKIAFKMGESDPWFEDRQQQLETLEAQLRRLQASLEGLYSHRRELAYSTAALGRGLALLSNGEDHTGLLRTLAKMAELQDKLEAVHHEQANSDFYILHELLKDYVALLGVVKDVFHERVKAFQTWQHAQQMLVKKREAVDRWESAGRSDKVAPAKDEVLEWEAKVNRSQEEFDSVSNAIKKELERFEIQRVKDFKSAFILYLEAQLKAQEKIIEHWETYMPEAKAMV